MIDAHALPELGPLRRRAGIAGAIGLAVWLGGTLVLGLDRSAFSYLAAFLFWLSIGLGCLGLALLHTLTGGRWGLVIRRPLEAAAGTVPVMGLLLLPLLLVLPRLYTWARPEAVLASTVLQHKHAYLNVPFFLVRALIYFVVWSSLVRLLWRRAAAQETDMAAADRLSRLAGLGLVLYALTVTFASIDWIMSLDAEWFSTIFGILVLGGQALSGLAFVTAVLVLLARGEPLASVVRPLHYHDLGKLMLAFVMLWAYFNFSQFLIIWAGNLPEETPWYLRRMSGDFRWLGLVLVLGHFVLPFLMLLSADIKKRAGTLAAVALLVLVMRCADMIWLIAPEHRSGQAGLLGLLMDVAATVAVGGLWLRLFLTRLAARPLLPTADPEWQEIEAES